MSDTRNPIELSRRHFLAGAAGAVAAVAAGGETASAQEAPNSKQESRNTKEAEILGALQPGSGRPVPIGPDALRIENEVMRVQVDRTGGVFRLVDKAAAETWEPDPWVGAPGILVLQSPGGGRREINLRQAEEISVVRAADAIIEISFRRLRLSAAEGTLEAGGKTRLTLVGVRGPLRVEVLDVRYPPDWKLVELEYPCRLGALRTDVDEGYLIVPYQQGCIVPSTVKNWKQLPRIKTWSWDDGPWMEHGAADVRIYGWQVASLPMFGLVKGKSTLAAIIETEDDASLRLVLNSNGQHVFSRIGRLSPYARLAATSPLWLAERKQFGYSRSVLYEFLPDGGYVAAAKHYRRYAREHGLLVTLREKIERTPALDKIIGGPWVNLGGGYPYYIDHPLYRFTWNDARKFVDDLLGYVGAQRALLTLWIGYQHLPPDSYPFHPAQGSLDELRGLVQYAARRNVLINFYHGLPALLEDAPNADVARARKSNAQGTMSQRWGRHCPRFFLSYAQKNLPAVIRDSGILCDYEDILTAAGLGECWDSQHPLSRRQDRACREETMKYIARLGLFCGSEWPAGYSIPYLAYFRNGHAGAGSHWILNQHPVPLFNLVFKDCALMYGPFFPLPGLEMIRDLAAGCHFQLTMQEIRQYYADGFRESRVGARASVRLFQDWLRATGTAELVTHEFLDELNGPYRTRFSDGSEALVNPTTELREAAKQQLPPESILLRLADGRQLQAAAKVGWDVETR